MKYVVNTKTKKLHIEGCNYIYNVKADNYKCFDSENEARMYMGIAFGFCTICAKKREEILKRK